MKSTARSRLLGSSALIGAAFLCFGGSAAGQSAPTSTETPVAPNTPASAPAFGPDVSAAALSKNANGQTPTSVQEVVVTGSRIRSPSLTSTSPLTVVGSQEILNTGATAVESVLNELPSVVAGQNSGLANLSNGTATVSLRGLGSNRTLVLVDGKRLMPGDPQTPVADLNVIPSGLVDRVDIVTGGASAVYGSDAVAGVVNFIMKKDFQGFRFEVTDDAAQHSNGDTVEEAAVAASNFQQAPKNVYQNLAENFSAIMGVNAPDGKGNITAYAGYRHLQPILEQLYDSSACTISASQGSSPVSTIYKGHACGGSSNGLFGKFIPASSLTTATLHDNTDGTQSFVTTKVPSYNYGATNYFQRSETRYTGGYFGHYDINPSLSIYSDFMFADDQTVGQIAPSGFFGGTGPAGSSTFNINCNNPLLTATQQGQLCGPTAAGTSTQVPYEIGYRFASFPRDYGYGHIDYKFDIGAKGTFGEAWSYDAYLQYGTSILSNLLRNDVSTSKLQNALLVDPATGKCLTGGASCVPINIFQAGGVTPAAFNYVSVPAEQQGQTVEQIASASVTGDLGHYGVKSPLATDGVGVAFGTEYRRESLTFTPDNEYITGDLSGTGTAKPNSGSFDVYELFGEVRVPIVQNAPFVKDLNFNSGYRFSDYNTAGVTDTYKLQFEYAPTADIRFRGGYNRATRAPNVVELFKTQTVGLGPGPDPCVGAKPAAQLAECVATGLPAALYGNFNNGCPAGQCGALNGGNPALKPETSDTYTGGFVLTPTASFARGFTLSVDYFNIKVNHVISQIPTSVSASQCVSGNLEICSTLLHRDPATFILYGQQGYIVSTNINSGYLSTDGIDLEANYRKRLSDIGLPDWGVVSMNLLATYTHSFIDEPVVGGGTYNCAGLYGPSCSAVGVAGGPLPKIKGKFRVTYAPSFAPVTISAAWRYVGPVKLDANTTNSLLTNHPYGITDVIDNSIHPFSYLDATVTWRIRDKVTLTAGCNNLLDKDPPVSDSGVFVDTGTAAGNGNTYPGTYDQLGRTVFATLTADF